MIQVNGRETRGRAMHAAWSRVRNGLGLRLGLGIWGLAFVCGVQGCEGATGPEDVEDVMIVLSVSGGLAGVDWQITIDGRAGRIVGDRCRDRIDCDWAAGEVLAMTDPAQLLELARRFVDAGFLEVQGTDFGNECCDQFAYEVSYSDDDDHKTVSGSDGTLPSSVLTLIGDVRSFVSESRDGA